MWQEMADGDRRGHRLAGTDRLCPLDDGGGYEYRGWLCVPGNGRLS